MGEDKIERDLMDIEEFEEYLSKNIKHSRAVRRGNVTEWGYKVPKRPFNNRANSSKRGKSHSRGTNKFKQDIYEQFRKYREEDLD